MNKLYFIGIIFLAGLSVFIGFMYVRITGSPKSSSLVEQNRIVQFEQDKDIQQSPQLPRTQRTTEQPQVTTQQYKVVSSSERAIGYITAMYSEDDKKYLKIDYITFSTSTAADKAANESGFDTDSWGGAPDGYWIENINTKIRTFEIDPAVEISMASSKYLDVGTVIEGKGLVIPYDVFYKLFNDPNNPDYMQDQKVPYWITLKGGMVVKIEQQYLP
jgi:hypothetical protein